MPQSVIERRKDDAETSSASVNKSPGTFTFSYKIKDGNNTIERSEKQSPNGSLNGYYTVTNLVNGFLRSIFYSADVDSFSASVYSNKPGDVNYTFPETTTTEVNIVDVTTAGNNGIEKEEINVITEVNTISQVNSTEGDFELVTSVVVDMVDGTTVREEIETTTMSVTSTGTTLYETTTAATATTEVTSTTADESSSETVSTPDSLSIPDGPISSAEIVSTSTPGSIGVTSNTSGTSILPSLWYEYEILLNGGRFYRSESTDPITGKLIGSYILLMDSQGGKATDASTATPPAAAAVGAAAAATSMSSSTVTRKPFIGQSELDKLASSSQPPTPSSVSQSNASGKQVEEGNSLELSPQEKQEERSTSSTALTVDATTPVTTATTTTTAAATTPISVTNSAMSSTVQSIAPAGDTSTSEEVIRRRRVLRLRKRHNIQLQSEDRVRLRQLQSTSRSNVQVSRSNYTSDLSSVTRKKQKHSSSHLRQIDHQTLMV